MTDESPQEFSPSCPFPLGDHDTVQLAHGGGRLMRGLIEGMFLPAFAAGPILLPSALIICTERLSSIVTWESLADLC